MKNLKKFQGHLCRLILPPLYQRIRAKEKVEIEGYFIFHQQHGWFFCVKNSLLEPFLNETLFRDELEELENKGVKILPVFKGSLSAVGDQKRSSPTFGHIECNFYYKFTDDLGKWFSE